MRRLAIEISHTVKSLIKTSTHSTRTPYYFPELYSSRQRERGFNIAATTVFLDEK
jgi:hypothetical protein